MSEDAWLEPIRIAATAVIANPPPMTEWEAGEDAGEVNGEVENLLKELGWPTRTQTFTVNLPVSGLNPRKTELRESTHRYFPGSWIAALQDRVVEYVKVRDANQEPTVPDRLRLRNLPQSADYDAFRDLVEGAWEDAWDELWCSVAVMWPYDAMSLDGLRYNLANTLWYGPYDPWAHSGFQPAEGVCPLRTRRKGTYAERLGEEEADSLPDLRNLPSPKWRAWYLDTWNDRIAINDALDCCGVEVTDQLDIDLQRAGYALDTDVSRMTIEELVDRVEAKHRLIASAFRAARDGIYSNGTGEPGLNPCRASNRPAAYAAIMETVGRLKDENMRWKEIREEVLKTHGYRSDSEDALRKQYERWQKGPKPAV